ncbi:hypothetical protein HELRODRAFT_70379 [Helobdella robusta]|uniref:CTLH domain-containing protein n=1 Tax=Helobdella robusta TaxID=6412 RepID=T1G059_HELRO|nr:hypothetical protein HELRODRAFT_70379 [Helobdella robusta]ESN91396.1 hypothetical protein HELRODRAFT_70379 [Helobdella robusta]
MVSTYLAYQGYSLTAETFSHITGQTIQEDIASIKHRQKIQHFIMAGRISEAINLTNKLYPSILDNNHDLLFKLKCRQFIEMVNGTDDDYTTSSSSHFTSATHSSTSTLPPTSHHHQQQHHITNGSRNNENNKSNQTNGHITSINNSQNNNTDSDDDDDVNMDTSESANDEDDVDINIANGTQRQHNGDGFSSSYASTSTMTTKCCNMPNNIERILMFGRDLHVMSERLKKNGDNKNEENEKALKEAFSLLAYSDPWNSPVGHQLHPSQREVVCKLLNCAILEQLGQPTHPPLEIALSHASKCLKVMSKLHMASCAFTTLASILA